MYWSPQKVIPQWNAIPTVKNLLKFTQYFPWILCFLDSSHLTGANLLKPGWILKIEKRRHSRGSKEATDTTWGETQSFRVTPERKHGLNTVSHAKCLSKLRKQTSGGSRTEVSPVNRIKCPHLEFSSSESMRRTRFYVQLYHTHISLQIESGNPTVYVRKKGLTVHVTTTDVIYYRVPFTS